MRIAVCENSPESAERLRGWIQQFCALYQVPAVLKCFSSPDGFAEEPEPFDIVYMGFGGSSGFSQARQLRDRDRECRIILVDDTPEFAIRGMRLHCVDFYTYIYCSETWSGAWGWPWGGGWDELDSDQTEGPGGPRRAPHGGHPAQADGLGGGYRAVSAPGPPLSRHRELSADL